MAQQPASPARRVARALPRCPARRASSSDSRLPTSGDLPNLVCSPRSTPPRSRRRSPPPSSRVSGSRSPTSSPGRGRGGRPSSASSCPFRSRSPPLMAGILLIYIVGPVHDDRQSVQRQSDRLDGGHRVGAELRRLAVPRPRRTRRFQRDRPGVLRPRRRARTTGNSRGSGRSACRARRRGSGRACCSPGCAPSGSTGRR